MVDGPIDLRSDTITRPSPAMREAMARAEVGDDVYGEDPTLRRLEATVAALLGKEAALFVPSGTMSNQLALLTQTQRGDEVIVSRGAHMTSFESGAGAALAGVQFALVGEGGLFGAEDVLAAAKPERDYLPRTRLVAIENTHNTAGGRVFPQEQALAVAGAARRLGLGLHLDGARLWNASAASGIAPDELCAPFDTVSVCFSKGLGAPVGSAFVASRDLVRHARRLRKMLGGGMRQAGVLGAGALYALEHQRARLVQDHEHAALLAREIAGTPGLLVASERVETNIVMVETVGDTAEAVAEWLAQAGVLAAPLGPRALRFVTHLDVDRDDILEAARRIRAVLERPAP
jgi:threonine aldolase